MVPGARYKPSKIPWHAAKSIGAMHPSHLQPYTGTIEEKKQRLLIIRPEGDRHPTKTTASIPYYVGFCCSGHDITYNQPIP